MDPAARRFEEALIEADEFFQGTGRVHRALERLVRAFEDAGVPYAIAGGMALNAHGFRRVTSDIDVVLTDDGLRRFRERWLDHGYVGRSPGRGLRDTANGVDIDVVPAGTFPGDGRPKPVAFPDPVDPAQVEEIGGVRYLTLHAFVEVKLASGLSAAHRLTDLVDVQRLIEVAYLPRETLEELNPYVRAKFLEHWELAQVARVDPIAHG